MKDIFKNVRTIRLPSCQHYILIVLIILIVSQVLRESIFIRADYNQLFEKKKPVVCHNVSLLPTWSWGLSKRCCDIFPSRIGKYNNFKYEGGDLSDNNYFHKKKIMNGSVVYVASIDMPKFVTSFQKLPLNIKITLVSGIEDIGVPWELWHRSRREWDIIWSGNNPSMDMKSFIADPRLNRWYTQNYDLIGCNPFYCSDINSNSTDGKILYNKVIPIPIGLDFHTEAGKYNIIAGNHQGNVGLCNQRKQIEKLKNKISKFDDRPLKAIGSFNCKLRGSHVPSRGKLCELLHIKKETHKNITLNPMSKNEYWESLNGYAFSLAPAGHGIDTHRLWEILNLYTVPITLTSSLDRLYNQFPIIIISDWNEIFEPYALIKYKNEIQARFGKEPFLRDEVRKKLTMRYWIELIRSNSDSIMNNTSLLNNVNSSRLSD